MDLVIQLCVTCALSINTAIKLPSVVPSVPLSLIPVLNLGTLSKILGTCLKAEGMVSLPTTAKYLPGAKSETGLSGNAEDNLPG